MLLVICGAGASYDSDRRRSYEGPEGRLPLAKDLFSPRFASIVAKFDAVQGIIGRLRQGSPSVEQTLEDLMEERTQYPHRTRQLLGATYCLRETIDRAQRSWMERCPDHVTNYVELVELIERWRSDHKERVAYITFNYDTLLEDSIHAVI